MELIKEIKDEREIDKLINYLEMLRKDGIVYKNYEGVEDLSDVLDETFIYEYVEYTLDEKITEILKPLYNTIRIEIDYRLNEFDLARIYVSN